MVEKYDALLEVRRMQEHQPPKLRYKTHLLFLNRQSTITQQLANHTTRRGRFLFSYKLCRAALINLLRFVHYFIYFKLAKAHYLQHLWAQETNFHSYFQTEGGCIEYNQSLYAHAQQFKSLFRLLHAERIIHRRLRKFIYLKYVAPNRRLITIWRWIGLLIQAHRVTNPHLRYAYEVGFAVFLFKSYKQNPLTHLRVHVYTQYLLNQV